MFHPHPLSGLLLLGRAPRTRGTIAVPGLGGTVEVTRDAWGIPHISAGSEADAFFAQGFVHAQDRLWQMDALRRLTAGCLAEVGGAAVAGMDWLCRAAGLPEMKRRIVAALGSEERSVLEAYAAGVNACIESMGRRLPLELAMLKRPPRPWTVEDSVSVVPWLSWAMLLGHFGEKLLALSQGGRLSAAQWNDMVPGSPGALPPADDWFERSRGLRLGAIHPAAFSFHGNLLGARSSDSLVQAVAALAAGPAASNNWAVARGADGFPLLANDPHLGTSLPAVWHFCHLYVPGRLNAAGGSLAGSPGIVIGRNERVAWGFTNVMMDALDILTVRVDPHDPLAYEMGGRRLRMAEERIAIDLPRGEPLALPVHRTEAGPVITGLAPGVDSAAVLTWYGTAGAAMPHDGTVAGQLALLRAGSVAQAVEAGRSWAFVAQNLVCADAGGHIGWHATGAAPLRSGYSGRLPGDATAGQGWTGFHPYDALPSLVDPPAGRVVTANYRPDRAPPGPTLSHAWFPPYRRDRIEGALDRMPAPTVEDFRRLQADVHSPQADRILPRVLALAVEGARAREGLAMLAGWDREVRADSAGAAVFEVFLTELSRGLLVPLLGDDIGLYFSARMYGIENEIFDRPASPLWKEPPGVIVSGALDRTIAFCESRMGRNRRRWRWGRLHRYSFRHPAGRGRLLSALLNPTRLPAGGDGNTVNVASPGVSRDSYTVGAIPSLRMVVPLGDIDGMRIAGPLGQSGQPGHRHYDDMTATWARGDLVPLPLSRSGVAGVARRLMRLVPAPRLRAR